MGKSRRDQKKRADIPPSPSYHSSFPKAIGAAFIVGASLVAYWNYTPVEDKKSMHDAVTSISSSNLEQHLSASTSTREISLGDVEFTTQMKQETLSNFTQQMQRTIPGATEFTITRTQRSFIATCDPTSPQSRAYLDRQRDITRRIRDYFGLTTSIELDLLSPQGDLKSSPEDRFVAYLFPSAIERFRIDISFKYNGTSKSGYTTAERETDDAETLFNFELVPHEDGTAEILKSEIRQIIIPMGDHPANQASSTMEYLHHASRARIARGLRTSVLRPAPNGQFTFDLDTEMHFNEAVVHGCGLAALEELRFFTPLDISLILGVYAPTPRYARVPEFLERARRIGARNMFSAYLEDKRE